MQKSLYIIRHSKAKLIKSGQNDFDRKLSKKGIGHAQIMGDFLLKMGVEPDKFYVSPARRTKMTAETIAEMLKYDKENFIFENNIYEAGTKTLLDVVNNFDDQANTVFLIGHNPGLTMLADYLGDTEIGFMPTSGIVYLTFNIESWKHVSKGTGLFRWHKSPKML